MRLDVGLLGLRILPSLMLLLGHGMTKLLQFSQYAAVFPDPLHVGHKVSLVMAIVGEVVCPIAVMLGIGTRFTAVPPLITMLVAAVLVHAHDPWSKKEFAILYAVPF